MNPAKASFIEDTAVQLRDLTVLAIEDSATQRFAVERALLHCGLAPDNVTCVGSLGEALDALEMLSPELVLTDLGLPDASGVEAVRALRVACENSTILVRTGVRDEATAMHATREGADGYLVKGHVDSDDLKRAIVAARERRRRHRELHEIAHRDELTTLANRRYLLLRGPMMLMDAQLRNQQVYLVYLDLNGFKPINDELGHAAGDTVLSEIGRRLAQLDRVLIASRLGGDEFVLITDAEQQPLARFVAAVEECVSARVVVGERSLRVTTSVGVAQYPQDGNDIYDLLEVADLRMLHHKERQRQERAPSKPRPAHVQCISESSLLYEPRTDLTSGELCGVVATLPGCRTTLPSRRTGTPVAQTQLLDAVAEDLEVLSDSALSEVPVSIGLAARPSRFALDRLEATCCAHGMSPSNLEFSVDVAGCSGPRRHLIPLLEDLLIRGFRVELAYSQLPRERDDAARLLAASGIQVSARLLGSATRPLAPTVRRLLERARFLAITLRAGDVNIRDQAARVESLGFDTAQGQVFGGARALDEIANSRPADWAAAATSEVDAAG